VSATDLEGFRLLSLRQKRRRSLTLSPRIKEPRRAEEARELLLLRSRGYRAFEQQLLADRRRVTVATVQAGEVVAFRVQCRRRHGRRCRRLVEQELAAGVALEVEQRVEARRGLRCRYSPAPAWYNQKLINVVAVCN
jgi:hypothetical protein